MFLTEIRTCVLLTPKIPGFWWTTSFYGLTAVSTGICLLWFLQLAMRCFCIVPAWNVGYTHSMTLIKMHSSQCTQPRSLWTHKRAPKQCQDSNMSTFIPISNGKSLIDSILSLLCRSATWWNQKFEIECKAERTQQQERTCLIGDNEQMKAGDSLDLLNVWRSLSHKSRVTVISWGYF